MKILYQWAQKNPQGWQEIDAKDWKNLPKLLLPKKGELGGLNNIHGWIRNVNVQGITTEGYDHIAIEPVTIGNDEGVKLTVWNDDPDDAHINGYEDWVNEAHGVVWIILPLAPDPKHGMAINTRQYCKVYAKGKRYDMFIAQAPENTTVRPWEDFAVPDENITRHGVWMSDEKHEEHVKKAPQHEYGWMHWNEHLPDHEVEIHEDKRKLKEQRLQGRYKQAEHTKTYYQRSTARAVGAFTMTNENALELTTAASSTQSVTLNANSNVACWSFTTPANEPNNADWPNGSYRVQLNCTAVSAGDSYKVGFAGGWNRVSSDTNSVLQNMGNQAEANFTGTGLKLATLSVDPTAGSVSDILTNLVYASGTSHGDAITLQFNTTDSFSDGPWPSGATGEEYIIIT